MYFVKFYYNLNLFKTLFGAGRQTDRQTHTHTHTHTHTQMVYLSFFRNQFLGAFHKIAKSAFWLRRVCPHGATRLSLGIFS
jgi:hypothetical protein